MNGSFERITGALDSPVAVLTTAADGRRAGCLIGFHVQASIQPLRYAFWLSKANDTYRVGLRATSFAMHFLDSSQHDLAARFGTTSGEACDKFDGLEWEAGDDGVPLLTDCQNRLALGRLAVLDDGGDHVCVTAEVRRADCPQPFEPLRLSQVADLEPAHPAEDRASL